MRRALLSLLVLAMVPLGCAGDGDAGSGGGDAPRRPAVIGTGARAPAGAIEVLRPSIAASPVLAPAADPKLPGFSGWPLLFDARHHDRAGYGCLITLERDGDALRALEGTSTSNACTAEWDGRDADGAWVDPGPVDVSASVVDGTGSAVAETVTSIEVVRLGIASIQLAPVAVGQRSPLLYRALDGVRRGYHEMGADELPWRMGPDATEDDLAVALERSDGEPRELPTPWEDLTSPPLDRASRDGVERDSHNLPTAWIAGAQIHVEATLSTDVAGAPGGGEPTVHDVRLVPPEDTEAATETTVEGGVTVAVRTTTSPVPAVGRYDWELAWTFEARRPGGEWVPVPGELVTTHRLYGLAAAPVFDYGSVPHRPWVDVVDTVAGWVDGATAEPDAVGAAIVDGVYRDMGLTYDRERGASFYTDYPRGWGGAVFDLSRFQERADGETINCSDAGSIVSTYANMMGLDFRYHILTHEWARGFDLHYIQAIGWDGFTETPFFSGRGQFRYHAVVGPADGRFFDATLALDGDGMPGTLPATLLLAQGMTPDAYKQALSSEWMNVQHGIDEQVRVR